MSTQRLGLPGGIQVEYTLTGLNELELTLLVPSDWDLTPDQTVALTRYVEQLAKSWESSVVRSILATDPSTSTPRASTFRGISSTTALYDEAQSFSAKVLSMQSLSGEWESPLSPYTDHDSRTLKLPSLTELTLSTCTSPSITTTRATRRTERLSERLSTGLLSG